MGGTDFGLGADERAAAGSATVLEEAAEVLVLAAEAAGEPAFLAGLFRLCFVGFDFNFIECLRRDCAPRTQDKTDFSEGRVRCNGKFLFPDISGTAPDSPSRDR
jgi:hypothetical protein